MMGIIYKEVQAPFYLKVYFCGDLIGNISFEKFGRVAFNSLTQKFMFGTFATIEEAKIAIEAAFEWQREVKTIMGIISK